MHLVARTLLMPICSRIFGASLKQTKHAIIILSTILNHSQNIIYLFKVKTNIYAIRSLFQIFLQRYSHPTTFYSGTKKNLFWNFCTQLFPDVRENDIAIFYRFLTSLTLPWTYSEFLYPSSNYISIVFNVALSKQKFDAPFDHGSSPSISSFFSTTMLEPISARPFQRSLLFCARDTCTKLDTASQHNYCVRKICREKI